MAQKTNHTWIVGLIAIVILAALGYILFKPTSSNNSTTGESSGIEVWSKGPADALVTLTEYADFQCPACASYQQVTSELAKQFPENLRIEFRHFPLTSIHSNALASSRAAEAAGKQGKFWEMHDLLFQRQEEWSRSTSASSLFEDYAGELDLNIEQFKNDLKAGDVKKKVDEDREMARQLGVSSTPTFYINGQKITNPRGLEPFRALIQGAIEKAKNDQQAAGEEEIKAEVLIAIDQEVKDLDEIESDQIVADNSWEVSFVEGTTVSELFDQLGLELTADCLTWVDETKNCVDDQKTIEILVNGEDGIEADYVLAAGDRVVVSYGTNTSEELETITEVIASPPCTYFEDCPER